MDAREINIKVVGVYKVLFLILGTIGNVLFIDLVIRKKKLRSRTSVLQCFQCFFHLFCQVGTIMNGIFDTKNTLNRSECFDRIAFYIFFQAAQGLIMIVIVLDILVFVKFPMSYKNLSLIKYIFFTATPVLIYSIITTYIAYSTRNDDPIATCSPPFVFTADDSAIQKYLQIFFSILVMVLYLILIKIFNGKRQNRNSLKTVKRLRISVFIYCFTWFFSQLFSLFILKVASVVTWGGLVFAHVYLFICLSYSNTFYVTVWRSKEYRDQFYKLWWPGRNQLTSTNITVLQTSVTMPRVHSSVLVINSRK